MFICCYTYCVNGSAIALLRFSTFINYWQQLINVRYQGQSYIIVMFRNRLLPLSIARKASYRAIVSFLGYTTNLVDLPRV